MLARGVSSLRKHRFVSLLLSPFVTVFLAVFLGCAGCGWQTVRADESSNVASPYLGELIARANADGLANATHWRRLLYVLPGLFSRDTSIIDSPEFFFSPNGKSSPEKELESTLRAFFQPISDLGDSQDEHPQCRYPARFAWLESKLQLDRTRMPVAPCNALKNWLKQVDAGSVSLVFSSYFLNNPASMYGHTFMRFNRALAPGNAKSVRSPEKSALLDWAVNYAAHPDTNNTILYMFKGATGGFPGHFSMMPYYIKTEEYNNHERRDLWEYEFNLSPEQVRTVQFSLWELGNVRIDYYYFDENCSFMLLAVLETASDEFFFTRQFGAWVIPAETIRVVASHPGLVRAVTFRPSNATRFQARFKALQEPEKAITIKLIEGKPAFDQSLLTPLEKDSKARVLDAVLEFVDFELKLSQAEEPTQEWKSFRDAALLSRAKVGLASPPLTFDNSHERPEFGHKAGRFGLFGGSYRANPRAESGARQGGTFVEFEWRPALHDLATPGTGYPRSLELNFWRTVLRYNQHNKQLILKKWDLMSVVSATPLSTLTLPLSWRFSLGTDHLPACDGRDRGCQMISASAGAGVTVGTQSSDVFLYAIPGVRLGTVVGNRGQGFFAGPGLLTGGAWSVTDAFKLSAHTTLTRRFGTGSVHTDVAATAEAAFAFWPRFEARLRIGAEARRPEFSLGLFYY